MKNRNDRCNRCGEVTLAIHPAGDDGNNLLCDKCLKKNIREQYLAKVAFILGTVLIIVLICALIKFGVL